MSWALESRIIRREDRIRNLTKQSKQLVDACGDLDRRLIRLEAKFALLERMAAPAPRRRELPEKSEK